MRCRSRHGGGCNPEGAGGHWRHAEVGPDLGLSGSRLRFAMAAQTTSLTLRLWWCHWPARGSSEPMLASGVVLLGHGDRLPPRWLMSTHASVLVDSVGPPSAEVCRTAASFP
jgi:hypothetical protein